jgi:hypothetical protein
VDDLVQWLRAQLDEDERIARAASPGPWRANAEHDEVLAVDEITAAEGFALSGGQLRATVDHIAEHDPARVLREIDAKRRLVDLHAKDEYYDGCVICDNGNNSCGCMSGWHWKYPCDTLKILALPYADRPGYQDDWRP